MREKCTRCKGAGIVYNRKIPFADCSTCEGTGGVPSASAGLHPWIKYNREVVKRKGILDYHQALNLLLDSFGGGVILSDNQLARDADFEYERIKDQRWGV